MFRPSNLPRRLPRTRRGAILVVVLALLALFAVIGISFVFYADSEANAARIHREGAARQEPAPPDAVATINLAIASIIYDAGDGGTELNNPIRGHSILRSMYGWNTAAQTQNTLPFNGVGPFHENVDLTTTLGLPPVTPYVIPDRARWPNYTQIPFRNVATGAAVGVYLDPERTGYNGSGSGVARHYIGRNAPYTYPDLKDFFLASVSPATGEILVKSFHRDWLFNGAFTPNPSNATLAGGNPNVGTRLAPYDPTVTPGNTDWISPEGRTKILRPRPVDQLLPGEITAAGVPYPIPHDIAYNTTPAYATMRQNLANLITTKIANGEIMPYPAPNADGSYTGDVQNITGGVGHQKNDSILLDFGMPPIKYNGRYVQPLVAITILDQDGRVNLSAHGNILNNTAGNTDAHRSFMGMGPYEINPRRVFDPAKTDATANSEVRAVITERSASPQSRGGITTKYFDRNQQQLPQYALVTWNGSPNNYVSLRMPNFAAGPATGTALQTSPVFDGTGWDNNLNTTSQATNHPGLFNPAEWPGPRDPNLPNGRTFDPLDFRRMAFRYAASPDLYLMMDVGAYAPNYLRGASTLTPPPNQLTYRLDRAHPTRFMLTHRSASLDFPGMMPNVLNAGSAALQLTVPTTAGIPPQPSLGTLANTSFTSQMPNPTTGTPGTVSDFRAGTGTPAAHEWRNVRTALGPVDLNRPLADYRDLTMAPNVPTPQPLSPLNCANYLRAWADRHNLAKDIFARLIVATGANATVAANGDISISTTNDAQLNALRYLAQVAVNIVDYRDPDDASTPFLWRPSTGTLSTITDPLQLTQYPFTNVNAPMGVTTWDFQDRTQVSGRAVFGVEKPRLVINESYSEIANNPNETMQNPDTTQPYYSSAHVRFWVELLNPTSPAYSDTTTSGPLGDGTVRLRYEVADGLTTPYAVYRLAVVRAGKTGTTAGLDAQMYLNSGQLTGTTVGTDNVTGWVPPGTAPDIDYDFFDINPTNAMAMLTPAVAPNNGQYLADGNRARGIVLVGPRMPEARGGLNASFPADHEFNPRNIGGMGGAPLPFTNMIEAPEPPGGPTPPGGERSMAYVASPIPTQADLVGKPHSHIVMLRRLANPYLPPNDPAYVAPNVPTGATAYNPALPPNPYITVDFMNDVPAQDAVLYPGDANMTGRTARSQRDLPNTNNGFLPIQERFAVGKIQPYAGYAPPSVQPEVAGATPATVPVWNAPAGATYVPAPVFTTMGTVPNNTLGTGTFSCVVRQDPNPPPPPDGMGTFLYPKSTFGRHNGRADGVNVPAPTVNSLNPGGSPALLDTIAAPFDWFVHMDRPLANTLELRWVQAGKPHMVTQMFWQSSLGRGYSTAGQMPAKLPNYRPSKEEGLVPWFEPDMTDNQNNRDPSAYVPPGGTPAPPYPDFAYNRTQNGLYRAFEMLKIRPHVYGTPVGGKVHGRMNVNTMQDYRQMAALLDPPPDMTSGGNGNMFDAHDVYTGAAPYLYNRVVGSRTATTSVRYQADGTIVQVPVPGPTYDDIGSAGAAAPFGGYPLPPPYTWPFDPRTTPLDRPYKSFGAGEYGSGAGLTLFAGGGTSFSDANPATDFSPYGPGLKDTLMRTFPEPQSFGDLPPFNNPNRVLQVPRLWLDRYSPNPAASTANPAYLDRNHPYYRSEAARKLFNNVTTVSNTFTVHMTIVFHEVRTDPVQTWVVFNEAVTNRPLLGKEIYKDVPGDLRQQYFFVIDRTNATMTRQVVTTTDATGTVNSTSSQLLVGPRPAFTTLEADPIPADLAAMPPRPFPRIVVAAVQDASTNNVPAILADGVPTPINVNDPLYIGVGADMEAVCVRSIVSFAGGQVTLEVQPLSSTTAPPQFTKPHAIGASVSNVAVGIGDAANTPVSPPLPPGPPYAANMTFVQYGHVIGNPGPRAAGSFQYWNPQFQPVLPFVLRIR